MIAFVFLQFFNSLKYLGKIVLQMPKRADHTVYINSVTPSETLKTCLLSTSGFLFAFFSKSVT